MQIESDSNHSEIYRSEVFNIVCRKLAEIAVVDEPSVRNSEDFSRIGVDDTALIELAEILEDDLSERVIGFMIEDDDFLRARSVSRVVDYVMAQIHAAEEP